MDFIKSPLNYTGGKYSILKQIFPLFPKNIENFVDIFAGGANVGINAVAKKIILNDNLTYLMDLYSYLRANDLEDTIRQIEKNIKKYNLSLQNRDGYNELREHYNREREPIELLILTFYSFNHQIRFNNSHGYNVPFGKERSQYNESIKSNLIRFINALQQKNIVISKQNFDIFDYSKLDANDFIYCDPPYLITTGTYNDGKRGFTGWNETLERKLLDILDALNKKGVRFALSNVTHHKGAANIILLEWAKKGRYNIHNVNKDYTNSSYNAKYRNGEGTSEVLITNYD